MEGFTLQIILAIIMFITTAGAGLLPLKVGLGYFSFVEEFLLRVF
jgi:hypothetical protein